MAECCGMKRDSAFCPECGRQLRTGKDYDIKSLLRHCRQKQQEQESVVEKRIQEEKEDAGVVRGNHRRWIEAAKNAAKKWKSWADALEQLISREIIS